MISKMVVAAIAFAGLIDSMCTVLFKKPEVVQAVFKTAGTSIMVGIKYFTAFLLFMVRNILLQMGKKI